METNNKTKDLKVLDSCEIINISTNPTEPMSDSGTVFTENTYRGCGNYWVAIKDGLIVASASMDDSPVEDFLLYREYTKSKLSEYGTVISGSGSGGIFFCKNSGDLDLFNNERIYNVPAPDGNGNLGYEHTNFQPVY